MALVAFTDIVHGIEDGKVINVKSCDKVPASISGKALEILKEVGSVGEPVTYSKELDDKDAQIEELKRQLAEAQAAATPVK